MESPRTGAVRVDMLVVGAGVTGLYQLYRARELGLSCVLVESGDGVGGTWFWNRYPEARFDSESYAYGYLFSKELFEEWEWSEHFAGQPEIERYLNHVVDRFGLRQHIRLCARVVSAVYDESTGTYTVDTSDGSAYDARYVVAATGVLSMPYLPDVPGREDFEGESYHTGLWPLTPVDFTGKRVAVVGTGSSGVQLIPAIAGDVASLTVYQRSPNWCTPLNNSPITIEEQEQLRANYESIRQTLETSASGFLHQPLELSSDEHTKEQRREFFESLWSNSRGFEKLDCQYADFYTNPALNRELCDFIAEKIRGIVEDPTTADELIPKDHTFSQKRPPFVTGYYDVYNKPNVSLVSLRKTPMLRVTPSGIETSEELREFDIIVWATGFDFGTGALNRLGVRGRNGMLLEEKWKEGPSTYLGLQTVGFPNFFFPGGPHNPAGNVPRLTNDQVDFIIDLLDYLRAHDFDTVEPSRAAEERWTSMVDKRAVWSPFAPEVSYFFGSNIPGKPRKYLLNPLGRPKALEIMAENRRSEFEAFEMSRSAETLS